MAKRLRVVKKGETDGVEPPSPPEKPELTPKTWVKAKRLYLEGQLSQEFIALHCGVPLYKLRQRIYRGTNHAVPWSRIKRMKHDIVQAAYNRTIEEHKEMVQKTKQMVEEKINHAVTALLMDSDKLSPDDIRKLQAVVDSLDKIERLEEEKPTSIILTKKVTTAEVVQSLREMGGLNSELDQEEIH